MYIKVYNYILGVLMPMLLIVGCDSSEIDQNLRINELEIKISQLEDSLSNWKNYYHFEKIKPMVFPSEKRLKMNETYKFPCAIVADGMYSQGIKNLDLTVSGQSKHNDLNFEKVQGIANMVISTNRIGTDTIPLLFKFGDKEKSVSEFSTSIVITVDDEFTIN